MRFGCMARRFELGSVVSVFFVEKIYLRTQYLRHSSATATMLEIRGNNLLPNTLTVFDGQEPEIWEYTISIEAENEVWQCSTQDVARNYLNKLPEILEPHSFERIITEQGFSRPKSQFHGFLGEDNLHLYYHLMPSADASYKMLLIAGIGEFQPGRYIANLEGLWKVHEI